MKEEKSPDQFRPERPEDLIGEARIIGADLLARASKPGAGSWKLLLFGSPGGGKTSIVRMVYRVLALHHIDIEKVNGRNVTSELVREWQRNSFYGSLFGGWKIKHIEEVDLVPQVAQDLMLTYLDDLPPLNAVIGTSNLSLETLTERFQTRFQLVRVHGPSNDELAAWLTKRWKIPKRTSDFIALGACGNVRQALLDATNFQIFGSFDALRPKAPSIVKDPAATARAQKAWETMRSRSAADDTRNPRSPDFTAPRRDAEVSRGH
jgi:replication-associated recombination protein RarA